jgi:hypothetical protein
VFFDGVRTYKESDAGKDGRDAEETREKVETNQKHSVMFHVSSPGPLQSVTTVSNREAKKRRLS